MKAISYSLFGYGQHPSKNCFEFTTYLRGMWTNMRVNRVLYPGWDMVVHVDQHSWNVYSNIFTWLAAKGLCKFSVLHQESLCKSMLWRLIPIFQDYDHVICRDIDSIATYREAQMVEEWIREDKTIHCITDSISHNIPMMGGMIGFRPEHLKMRMRLKSFEDLLSREKGIDYSIKGADQDFLNRVIYPANADSATEHFILGMKQTIPEGGGRHYKVPDIELEGVDMEQRCTNDLAGHVGAAGCYEPVMVRWLNTMDPYRDEYEEIEKQFPQLFFWRQ